MSGVLLSRDPGRETIGRLADVLELRDEETVGHTRRVARLCGLLARRAGLGEGLTEQLVAAAPLHDIGKVGVADRILRKPDRLTALERRTMERHAETGWRILAGSGDEVLELAALLALTHHERWDGRGYPRRLAGEEIPLAGRICAVADVYDALTNDRVYRRAFRPGAARSIMLREAGRHFDPWLVALFFADADVVESPRQGEARAWRR